METPNGTPYGDLRAWIQLEVVNRDDEPKVIAILDETYVVLDENIDEVTLLSLYYKAANIFRDEF
jgi:hypothetical protein